MTTVKAAFVGAVVVSLAFLTVGCDPQKSTSSSSPISQLKSIVRSNASSISWKSRDPSSSITYRLADGGITFDVTKTDSLVSPLEGQIRVRIEYESDIGGKRYRENVRFYAYQDGQWVADPVPGSIIQGSLTRLYKATDAHKAGINEELDRFLKK